MTKNDKKVRKSANTDIKPVIKMANFTAFFTQIRASASALSATGLHSIISPRLFTHKKNQILTYFAKTSTVHVSDMAITGSNQVLIRLP